MDPTRHAPRLVDRPLRELIAQVPALLVVGPSAVGGTNSAAPPADRPDRPLRLGWDDPDGAGEAVAEESREWDDDGSYR